MRTQLLSGTGKRVLSSMLVCCLWVCAIPTSARADAAFSKPTCTVQSVTMMGMTVWQIKGTASVTGLPNPPGNQTVQVKVQFARKAQGAKTWDVFSTVNQMPTASGGTATIDTGFIGFTPAPAQGEQFEIIVGGSYMAGPCMTVQIPQMASPSVTPNP